MDTSKEYIKMCDCPEIQEQWKPIEGDSFSFLSEPKLIKDYEIWALEKRELSDIEEWNKIIKTMGNHFVDHFVEARDCFVWLPHQDQIQEMMGKDYKNTLDMLCDFYAVITVDQPTGFQQMFEVSMEQLWLVFYMHEKHKKTWDGKQWKP